MRRPALRTEIRPWRGRKPESHRSGLPWRLLLFAVLLALTLTACGGLGQTEAEPESEPPPAPTAVPRPSSSRPPPPADLVLARQILAGMSQEDKVGQMFLARCPASNAAADAANYHLGGYVLFAADFGGRTPEQLRDFIAELNTSAGLPLLIAVDEEGGNVVRISRYRQYRETAFSSPQALLAAGGLELVAADTREKCAFLRELGINLNLAPVADVSVDSGDFIHNRSAGLDAAGTAAYVETVVAAMADSGVSGALKHFPGYGPNHDTHQQLVRDQRPADDFYSSDLLPFTAGIAAGAQLVLVSHNIVAAFDDQLPASLSPAVHDLLREELGFAGLIVTDDLVMAGAAEVADSGQVAVLAVAAGNDLLLASDYRTQISAVLEALDSGELSQELVDSAVIRILRHKINAGLIELEDAGATS